MALGISNAIRKCQSLMRLVKQRSSLGFPFHIPSEGIASAGIRRGKQRVRRELDQHRSLPVRLLLDIAGFIGWPLYLAGTLRDGVVIYAQRTPDGTDSRHNFLFVYWYCLRHQLTAPEYFLYRLDDPGHRFDVDDYLFSDECRLLVGTLNSMECNRLINDKLAFQDLLSSQALPVPITFEVSADSRVEDAVLRQRLNDLGHRLWVKPRGGSCGVGAEEWQVEDGKYRSSDGRLLSAVQLLEHLRAKAGRELQDQLVQEQLSNHPDLETLSNGALCVLRVVTISTTIGPHLVALAYMDLPCGEAIQSNRGAIALVDVEEGRLLGARLHRDMDRVITTHPDTDHRINGFHLPEWDDCKRLLQQSHQSIDGARCLAWDVALTTQGPVIIETNAYWMADEFQRLMQRPVGQTGFGDALSQLV